MRIGWRMIGAAATALLIFWVTGAPGGAICRSGLAPEPVTAAPQDPQEPPEGKPKLKLLPAPSSPITSGDADQKELSAIIDELVACGTRSSLSSWKDTDHEIGCGRNRIASRFEAIAKATGGQLRVKVDRFEAASPRTGGKPLPLENVVAILPGTDPALANTAFVVSGHFDSRASDVMDSTTAAPGADDDASGVAVSLECARLLASWRPAGGYRASLVFAAVSGEEQGLLGSKHLVEHLRSSGDTVGGMLDDDIVGADSAPGAPHRVRVFSAGGPDGAEGPSRELARTVEEIDSSDAVRLIFRLDRLGRGGDHIPFVEAGLPAVRFTEPIEDYRHQHQTPRVENGVQYGDLPQYLNFEFLANVVRDNAEVLRELALAPAPPQEVTLSGAVTPNTTIAWRAPRDSDRSGFEILWRETTAPRWSVYEFAAQAGETTLNGVSTDNHFFAVRSVGSNGARSIAVPAVLKPSTPARNNGPISRRAQ